MDVLGNLDIFHVGLVVEDIELAMEQLGRRLALDWAPLQERDQQVFRGTGEPCTEHIRFTYSRQGTPHLELIESRERRLWSPGAPGQLHHVGAFSEDLPRQSALLVEQGAMLEMAGGDGSAPAGFAYHLLPGPMRVELVEAARRPEFEAWMAGGDFRAR